jgi:ribosomal protein S18 acetylase RimI-like enzyme
MNFDFTLESVRTPALELDYHLVPWDSEIFGTAVAQISRIEVKEAKQATLDYQQFVAWRAAHGIQLCASRVPQDSLNASMFLQADGFRFIELNYLPRLADLQTRTFNNVGIEIAPAVESDREALADMAALVLRHGRFHQDPRIDPSLGDKRYRVWMINAFSRPQQSVLKCMLDGRIVAFFVIEHPDPKHCFWSLIGLAPGLQGQGLGKRVWNAMLSHHRDQGIDCVSTSISSHNVAVFNLYVSLGFRFPAPSLTLQWRPPGSDVLSSRC